MGMKRILVVLLIKQRVLLFLLAFLTSVQVTAQTTYGDLTVSKLLKVYDGDTIYVDIDEIHPLVGKNIGIKLQSVDAPEFDRRAKCDKEKKIAQEAKAFVEERLVNAKTIELRNVSRGKWFRIVADIFYDGKDLAPELLEAQYGRPYRANYDYEANWDWCAITSPLYD